jgi:hypothetical protein
MRLSTQARAWIVFIVCAGFATGARAQDDWTWGDVAELSVVWTGGNSSSSTLGAKNTVTGGGGKAKFNVEIGGIRTESSTKTRLANGTTATFTVVETNVTQLTAESYFARSRGDYALGGKSLFFGGAGWERNTFAGIENRFTLVSGLGIQWTTGDDFSFRTDFGGTYTIQDNVAVGPTSRFGGLRFTWDLSRRITDNTAFDSRLIVDENLKTTADIRADFTNSLSVSMSERLALKTSLQLLVDNLPSFVDVPLVTGGTPTGTRVPAPLKKVDSVFTIALVINVR